MSTFVCSSSDRFKFSSRTKMAILANNRKNMGQKSARSKHKTGQK